MQVFWPWSSLRMSACTVPRTVDSVHSRIFCGFVFGRLAAVVGLELGDLLVDGGVEEQARMIGAGPLMVIDTEVVGAHRSKPS
jgi:hypothetical protein